MSQHQSALDRAAPSSDEQLALARRICAGSDARAALAAEAAAGRVPTKRRRELDALIADGDAARDEFVRANHGLVALVANRYGRNRSVDDLIQEGQIGLIAAVERFDWERGFQFSTYAYHWIRKCVLEAARAEREQIRLPGHAHTQRSAVRRAQDELHQQTGVEADDAAVADATGMDVDAVRAARATAQVAASLSEPRGDSGRTIADLITDSDGGPEAAALRSAARIDAHAALARLESLADAELLAVRFGLRDGAPVPVAEVAERLGLTAGQVLVHEARALDALRRHAAA